MIPAALRNGSVMNSHSLDNDSDNLLVYPYELMPLPTQEAGRNLRPERMFNCLKNFFSILKNSDRKIVRKKSQIAGHGSEGDGQRAILKRADGKILKPVQPPPKGQREVDFYTAIQASKNPVDLKIRKLIPDFFGVETIGLSKNLAMSGDYLVLQDITDGFLEPNIMDVKMGAKTYGPDASEMKMIHEDSKYVGTKGPFGYSVTGMIVHSLSGSGEVVKYDKNFGKTLKSENVHLIPETFFDLKSRLVPELLEIVIDQMTKIFDMFNEQRKYKVFASSLLLAYDAAAVKKFLEGSMDRQEMAKWTIVRVIDFAHVFDAEGQRDDNFLTGLENLLTLFKASLNNRK